MIARGRTTPAANSIIAALVAPFARRNPLSQLAPQVLELFRVLGDNVRRLGGVMDKVVQFPVCVR